MRRQGASTLSASSLRIRRSEPYGSDVTFSYPPVVQTGFMRQHTPNDVVVIFLGTNADSLRPTGPAESSNFDRWNTTLISGIRQLVDNIRTRKYIVVGPYCVWGTPLSMKTWGDYGNLLFRMGNEFGPHFLNQLQFAVEYGLSEEGITPTAADQTAIAAGNMPRSLLRSDPSDNAHMNISGYDFLGKQIFRKGVELGYWKG
jgi:lysophospholipase L1-like esterase